MGELEALIRQFDLKPHPEGGYFKETYRAEGIVAGADRNFSTAIYYLLPQGQRSKLHRIPYDEMWHFYLGDPMTVAELLPDGTSKQTILGQDLRKGQALQYMVKAGHWFGAYPEAESRFAFVGCTVAPGFDFRDLEMGKRDALLERFPLAREVILRLT